MTFLYPKAVESPLISQFERVNPDSILKQLSSVTNTILLIVAYSLVNTVYESHRGNDKTEDL
jgi:hypothetical protein